MSLWPGEFDEADVKTAKNLLEEQAKMLPQLTKGFVSAELIKITDMDVPSFMDNSFIYQFDIIGKHLDNFRYTAFTLSHDIAMYPINIMPDSEILSELVPNGHGSYIKAKSVEQFEAIIAKVFHSNRMKNVISSLMALSKR